MKFGKTEHPERIDFALPADATDTARVLGGASAARSPVVHVGCAKWNKQDLKNFYPRGTRDELTYYSSQFNTIELNATFYRIFAESVFAGWREKTPDDFMFFPKLPQIVSHRKRLRDVVEPLHEFLANASALGDKLDTFFLQMTENFGPKGTGNLQALTQFVREWPRAYSLAVELRHADWFADPEVAETVYTLFETHRVTNIITDTAARRDLLHMRLTTPRAFIRYVGANHESDYTRLDDWVDRLVQWSDQGIEHIGFFVHQNHELESPLLARHFIERLNARLGCDLKVPASSVAHQESRF